MTEDSAKLPEPSTRRFVNRIGDKITDQVIGWVLSGGAVTFIALVVANWSKIRAATWETRVPLALLIALAPPAAFGFYALYRVMRAHRRTPLYFTINPQQTHISEHWDGRTNQRLITLQLFMTVANPTRDRNIILYAYLKGTEPVMHLPEPIEVKPFSAMLEQHVLTMMTAPKGLKSGVFKSTVYFVDAAGNRYKQKLKTMFTPAPPPQPKPGTPVAAQTPPKSPEQS
jgi:hypothetical protein